MGSREYYDACMYITWHENTQLVSVSISVLLLGRYCQIRFYPKHLFWPFLKAMYLDLE